MNGRGPGKGRLLVFSRILGLNCFVLCVAQGCGGAGEPSYPRHLVVTTPVLQSQAFSTLRKAAQQAVTDGKKYQSQVSVSPSERIKAIRALGPALRTLAIGANQKGSYPFAARTPFTRIPEYPGWQLLSRALVWRIKEGVLNQRGQAALQDVVLAHQFAAKLLSGDARDSTLAFSLMINSRRAVAPYLNKQSAATLKNFASGIGKSLSSVPSPKLTLANEHQNMKAAVQFVQDAFVEGDFDAMSKGMGKDGSNFVSYLKSLKGKAGDKRLKYFEDFAAETEIEADYWSRLLATPISKRPTKKEELKEFQPKFVENRPWRRGSKHFFIAGRSFIDQYNWTISQTRLLVLESLLQARKKSGQAMPSSLTAFAPGYAIDLITGEPFVYRGDGPAYMLYSVGQDGIDNGGETDERYLAPDMRLEK